MPNVNSCLSHVCAPECIHTHPMRTYTHNKQVCVCAFTCIHAHPTCAYIHTYNTQLEYESCSLNENRNEYNNFRDFITRVVFKMGTGKEADRETVIHTEARCIKHISGPSEEEVPMRGTAQKFSRKPEEPKECGTWMTCCGQRPLCNAACLACCSHHTASVTAVKWSQRRKRGVSKI